MAFWDHSCKWSVFQIRRNMKMCTFSVLGCIRWVVALAACHRRRRSVVVVMVKKQPFEIRLIGDRDSTTPT